MDKNIQYTINKHIKSCKPLYIPVEDRLCKPDPLNCLKCMNYIRSRPAMRTNCTFGPMEQVKSILNNKILLKLYNTFIVIKIITFIEAILRERL